MRARHRSPKRVAAAGRGVGHASLRHSKFSIYHSTFSPAGRRVGRNVEFRIMNVEFRISKWSLAGGASPQRNTGSACRIPELLHPHPAQAVEAGDVAHHAVLDARDIRLQTLAQ